MGLCSTPESSEATNIQNVQRFNFEYFRKTSANPKATRHKTSEFEQTTQINLKKFEFRGDNCE